MEEYKYNIGDILYAPHMTTNGMPHYFLVLGTVVIRSVPMYSVLELTEGTLTRLATFVADNYYFEA
jgi:hypothetical protein